MFLDTNIVVDALRRFPPAVAYLETAEQQGTLTLSTPSQMELIIGCRNAAELRRLRVFLERFEIRSLSAAIGETALLCPILRRLASRGSRAVPLDPLPRRSAERQAPS